MCTLRFFWLPILLLIFAGCGSKANKAPAIGEAYAGPSTLNIRKEISPQSPVVATLQHGDHVQIIQTRRRFIRVRTAKDVEGWTDERNLLSPDELHNIESFSEKVKHLPPQGVASTNDVLAVHVTPDRSSFSYFQVKEGEKVEVLGHHVFPHLPVKRKPLVPPAPKKPKVQKKKESEGRVPPPPVPQPPKPPVNWLDISKSPPEIVKEREEKQTPVVREDWSLIRNSKGQAGWVISRRLSMSIPDEVAQYAEGRRITSYFPLADVKDQEGQTRHHWLWTTISSGLHDYDFDSFRVFIWNVRRNRYETAYINRSVAGQLPVVIKPMEMTNLARTKGAPATIKYPGFSLCLEDDNGNRVRKKYAFIVNVIRGAGEEPCEPSEFDKLVAGMAPQTGAGKPAAEQPLAPEEKPGLMERIKRKFADWKKKIHK